MFEEQGNEIVIPSNVLSIEGKKGSVIADRLLGGFKVDSELPFKVLKVLPIAVTGYETDCITVTMKKLSTADDLKLTKECLQELTDFGFGDFTIVESTI